MKNLKSITLLIFAVLFCVGTLTACVFDDTPPLVSDTDPSDTGSSDTDPSDTGSSDTDPISTRLTLQEVQNIIADSDTFEEIMSALLERQPTPDEVYGSGMSFTAFWLDEQGDEKILITHEFESVKYVYVGEDGETDYEILY